MQQYQLGKFLRARYGEFLGDEYTTEQARVQSTGVDRTLMSAQLVCAGLFPPSPASAQRWNPDLPWQPVPIHSQPLDQDDLLLVRTPCPRYNEALDEVKKSAEVQKHLSGLSELYQELSKHSGLTVQDPDDVQSLYSTLLAEAQFNLNLPDWTKKYFPDKMAAVTAYSFTLNAYNDELKKLKGGPLLKKIFKNIEAKSKDPKSKIKMYAYAGHDSTVANVLMALKVWEQQIPTYNIMGIVELHQLNDIFGIKVYLRNSTEHEPYLLKVPGCEDFCPLDKVFQLSKNIVPEDHQKDCMSHDPNYTPPPPSGP